jgi:beta-galactosidase
MQRVDTQPVIDSFEKMMADGANINFYMFFGGTNFGFTAGANDGGPGQFNSDVTSYDYDAPMDEAGDVTPKYMAIRESIAKFVPLPNIPVPPKTMKIKLPDLTLKPVSGLLDSNTKKTLGTLPVYSNTPLSFEALDQYSGFILYETILPKFNRDPVLLTVERLRDRAYIYVDRNFVGILERANNIYSLPISLAAGNKLQILVSNEGRINYGIPNDFKGILGRVIYGQHVLQNWTMTGYPLEDYSQIQNLISRVTNKYGPNYSVSSRGFIRSGPTVFHADFSLTADQIHDTYLDTTGWGKASSPILPLNFF